MDSLRCELLHRGANVTVTMVQLPALNTPQFDWSKLRFHRQPKPVPPIYQPKVAADAIVLAARSSRREIWVGGPSSASMFANKLAPGVGDWYLSRTGCDSQFTDEPIDPDRPNNLYEPLPGDAGVRGRFTEESKEESQTLWVAKNRSLLLLSRRRLDRGRGLRVELAPMRGGDCPRPLGAVECLVEARSSRVVPES